MGNLTQKGSVYLERDNDTDRLQKSVYIYTFVFTGTYTGPFCHNPVESRLIVSSSIPLEESVGHQKVQKVVDTQVEVLWVVYQGRTCFVTNWRTLLPKVVPVQQYVNYALR